MEHCIEEWSTGSFVKAKFEESTALPIYLAHFKRLESWYALNPEVVDKLLATMYKRCRCVCIFNYLNQSYVSLSRTTGISSEKSIPALTDDAREAARKELEAMTGETESEGEQ